MPSKAFRTFYKTLGRIRTLYEVTIHSYNMTYETGRAQLRKKEAKDDRVEIKLENQTVSRSIKTLTYHARDVYPNLLRSTLLIRLVGSYEAFLTDIVEEVAENSDEPFESDNAISLSPRQLLSLAKDGAIKKHIVARATRQLTNGSFQDKRRFFQSTLKVDIISSNQNFEELDEIHDRRHLYVHREGFADDQYEHKYPTSGVESGWRLRVYEKYLFQAMKVLHESALHVRNAIMARYTVPTVRWEYQNGEQKLRIPFVH